MTTVSIPTETPPTVATLIAAINAGQLALAADCFARDACLLTPDATAIRGREEIRRILAQLIDLRTRIELLESNVLSGADVATLIQRWRIISPGVGSRAFVQETRPLLALRRLERNWKLAIAAPWGWRSAVPE